MNTTTAAIQAGVTTDTIRTWCRRGAITAIKQAGRWIIDTASLAHRIAIGAMKRRRKGNRVEYTVNTMTAIGGNRWQKAGRDRVYLNDWERFAGLDVDYYKSGNICGAALDGRAIANSRAARLLGFVGKVYFDAADGQIHIQGDATAVEIRYLDGARETVDFAARIRDGIHAAVAAL